jgi:hypothetical protein
LPFIRGDAGRLSDSDHASLRQRAGMSQEPLGYPTLTGAWGDEVLWTREIRARILRSVTKRLRDRLRVYWWLWVLVVGAAVVLNEVFDREVAGDKHGHPGGDVLVAIVVVLIVLAVWDLVTRKSPRVQ